MGHHYITESTDLNELFNKPKQPQFDLVRFAQNTQNAVNQLQLELNTMDDAVFRLFRDLYELVDDLQQNVKLLNKQVETMRKFYPEEIFEEGLQDVHSRQEDKKEI